MAKRETFTNTFQWVRIVFHELLTNYRLVDGVEIFGFEQILPGISNRKGRKQSLHILILDDRMVT